MCDVHRSCIGMPHLIFCADRPLVTHRSHILDKRIRLTTRPPRALACFTPAVHPTRFKRTLLLIPYRTLFPFLTSFRPLPFSTFFSTTSTPASEMHLLGRSKQPDAPKTTTTPPPSSSSSSPSSTKPVKKKSHKKSPKKKSSAPFIRIPVFSPQSAPLYSI